MSAAFSRNHQVPGFFNRFCIIDRLVLSTFPDPNGNPFSFEPFAKLWFNRFWSDFAEIRCLTQTYILLIVGCLRHTLKIGESAEKLSAIVLQKAPLLSYI